MRRAGVVVGVVLAALVSRASADPAAEARFWDGRAREAYERHDYPRALALFLESYRAAPSANLLYNIGVAAMLAHEEALAYTHLDEFVSSGSTDTVRLEDARRRMTEMAGRLALVHVESEPPGAHIVVDRAELGEFGTTPHTIVMDPGAHTIHLELAGHTSRGVDVDVALGATREVSERLEPILGRVELRTTPAEIHLVAVNEAGAEHVLAADTTSLPLGRYRVRGEADGYRPAEAELRVTDAGAVLSLSLELIPTPTGRLLVDTGSVSARVSVDGTPRASTPASLEVDVGHHEVRVEADGFRPWSGEVEVLEGRARYVDLVLVTAE